MKSRISSKADLNISSPYRTTKYTRSTECPRQSNQIERNKELHNRTINALPISKERVSTVIKRDTSLRSAEQKNVTMWHNLNKTDKTPDPKDQSTTKSWYATIADILGTLHETVDTKRNQSPHT